MGERRHALVGDLESLEYAIANYVAKWGEHLTGKPYLGRFGPNTAGLPTGVANMAMTVIRKNIEADVVVIPRDAIPDGLVERLTDFDRACSITRSGLDSYDLHYINDSARVTLGDIRAVLRLLSGATTEGDER